MPFLRALGGLFARESGRPLPCLGCSASARVAASARAREPFGPALYALLRKRANLEADQQRLTSLCSHCAGCRELAEECEATDCVAYFSRARVGLLWERARELEGWCASLL